MKLLLERGDVNPNTPNHRGRTPVSWATENGHDAVVKLLLEREDINLNMPDDDCGRAPLSWAS